MKASALLVLSVLLIGTQAAQVVVFGDSWGSFSRRPFEQMFSSRGYDIDVDNTAIGGTTAKYWARNPNSLLDRVNSNPDAKWVWLTIGGNDGINELLDGRNISDIVRDVIANTRVFLDPLFRSKPNIKVVQFGYDIVNFEFTLTCRSLGNNMFPSCRGDITCQNTQMATLQYEYVDQLTKLYGGKHTALNLLGTMQATSRLIPGPYPNYAYFSPANLMSDCIHPTEEGFTVVFNEFWNQYWSKQV